MGRQLVSPLSKTKLSGLIREYGLQCDLFDTTRLVFAWDGLEYCFYTGENRMLYLENIVIRMDVSIGSRIRAATQKRMVKR
jgi:hypothetical protein